MPDGRAPLTGERFVNADLAATLRSIAESRGESFYRGELAERIGTAAAEHGAALTAEDVAAHESNWCGTISREFDGVALHEIPPNGQGIAALMAFGMLEPTPVHALYTSSRYRTPKVRRFVELCVARFTEASTVPGLPLP